MGVFDALPVDGGEMSAGELANKIGVDEILLGMSHMKQNGLIRANGAQFA